jgi:hypothetical protein
LEFLVETELHPSRVFLKVQPDMKNKIVICLAAFVVLFAISPVMYGHHGVSDYDMANVVTWHVTVSDFQFVNPHALLDFSRKNDQDKVEEWQGELQSPNMLARRSHWTKDTVKTGDQITIFGCPARNGSKTIFLRKVILSNGEEYPGG